MKIKTFTRMVAACFLLAVGSVVQAAEFNCFPADLAVPTTGDIKNLLSEAMPFVVREGSNRKSTLTKVKSVSSSGCNITVKFDAKLERKKKVIKKKRVVYGSATLTAEVGRFDGCLYNPKFTKLEYKHTTKITENLIKNAYNKRIDSKICPSDDGSFSF